MENEDFLPLATEYNWQYDKAAGQPSENLAALFLSRQTLMLHKTSGDSDRRIKAVIFV